MTSSPRTWAEIDLTAVRHNLAVAAGGGRRVIAIIKADAYGHGLTEIAKALHSESGLAAFGVATLEEAQALRASGIPSPIHLLSPSLPIEREEIIAADFWPSVSSVTEAEAFGKAGQRLGKKPTLHLVVDTGMGRIGIPECQFDLKTAAALAANPSFEITGLASHFPSADEDPTFTLDQAERFHHITQVARSGGLNPSWIHLANSAGILGFGDHLSFTNAARPGLMLYGISPLPEFQDQLRPALSLKTHVTLVRELPAGHGISYGRTFITQKPTRVATLAAGYGDGLLRHLSSSGSEILIGGNRCPLLGRVTMDQIMVDVTPLGNKVTPGDEAVLIGKQGDEEITATEMAQKAGTIPWEIFTSITNRVERIYTG